MEKLFENVIGSKLTYVEAEKNNVITLVFENGIRVGIAGKVNSSGEPYFVGGSYKKKDSD